MDFIIEGGIWFTGPILIMGLVALTLMAIASYKVIRKRKISGRLTDTILFLGFFSLAWGIFGQVSGMFQAAGAIVRAGEISPSLVWAGFRISLIAVLMGFMVLLVSSVGWFILRRFRR